MCNVLWKWCSQFNNLRHRVEKLINCKNACTSSAQTSEIYSHTDTHTQRHIVLENWLLCSFPFAPFQMCACMTRISIVYTYTQHEMNCRIVYIFINGSSTYFASTVCVCVSVCVYGVRQPSSRYWSVEELMRYIEMKIKMIFVFSMYTLYIVISFH